jgi:hypothetical protein
MNILIVTRLCIGYQRADIFEYRLALLEATAARSIRAQTDRDFTWVISTDCRAPEWVFARLEALSDNIVVFKRDPLVSGLTPIGGEGVRSLGDTKTAVVRLDDDDLLRRDFVGHLREIGTDLPLNSAITWENGFNLYEGGVEPAVYAWSGQGTTTISTADHFFNPYTTNHLRLGEKAKMRGGVALVDQEPMWVRTWHAASDSTAARGVRFEQAGGDANLKDYGVEDHQAVYEIHSNQPSPPHFGGKVQAASEVKGEIFKLYTETKKQALSSKTPREVQSLKRRMARLAHALYNA